MLLDMGPQLLFGVSVLFSFVAWGHVAARYVWPVLRERSRADALKPILVLHTFRFVGLSFLVPGVVSPDLPRAFAVPAAYGDLATAIVALIGVGLLTRPAGVVVAWAFNTLGTIDLLFAFYNGDRTGVGLNPGLQGAAFFISAVLVPLLLVTHVLAFRILLRRETPTI